MNPIMMDMAASPLLSYYVPVKCHTLMIIRNMTRRFWWAEEETLDAYIIVHKFVPSCIENGPSLRGGVAFVPVEPSCKD